jgi:hypothetical protein
MAKCTTGSAPKWDWDLIERLLMAGKTVREVHAMEEFGGKGMSLAYLKNQVAIRKLLDKRDEVLARAKAATDKTLVERRTAGVEEHHLFAFGTLEKLRMAIAEHQIKGSVKELREMIDLFQKYLEAAETSYGLKGADVASTQAVSSLNAMVALHIAPPSKAEEIEVQSVRVDYHHSESKKGSDAEGSESIFDPETDAEGMEKEGALLGAGDAEEYRNR